MPGAQLVSKASIAGCVCLGVVLASAAALVLKGCEGDGADNVRTWTTTETTTTTTTTTATTTATTTTTTTSVRLVLGGASSAQRIASRSASSAQRSAKRSAKQLASATWDMDTNSTNASQNNVTTDHEQPELIITETEGEILNKRTKKYARIAVAILCSFCAMLVLCYCCCNACFRKKHRSYLHRDVSRKDGDEVSRILEESYNGHPQADGEDASHPYEYRFTRMAIEKMVPDASIVEESSLG
jgi:hypothetical protein